MPYQQPPKTPIRFLIYVSKPFKAYVFGAILVVIIAAGVSQSLALFFKWIIEAVEAGNLQAALVYGLLYPVLVLFVQLMYRASGWLGLTWAIGVKKEIGEVLFNHTLGHSHTYFSNRFAGSLLNKITNVIGAIDSLISDFLWAYLSTFVVMSVTFVYIFGVDPQSGLLFLVLTITLLIVNRVMMKRKQQLSKQVAAASTKLRGSMVDVFANVTAMRQYSARSNEEAGVRTLNEKWQQLSIKSMLYTEGVLAINAFILFLFSGAIFYLLIQRWGAGDITTAEFVFVLALMSQITGTLIFIGRVMTHFARVMGEAEEGLEDILVPFEIEDETNAKALSVSAGKIEFASVGFKYEENDIFKDFTLAIKPGERIGLVGHSGAGKTTFVSLLLRQHDLTTGQILIDGQDIKAVTQSSLREAIAVVPQEPALFHRTIKENIAYGKRTATDDEIIEVARKAQAHDFIMSLPLQYETLVGERGIKLSGGQKQRIAIARAMLKDAPILILDEATSALDSESEVAIQAALAELMKGKTVIAVAHRLSTLREMDRIIVLDSGQIIEDGSHEVLTQAGGVYQKLWEHQAGGFLTE